MILTNQIWNVASAARYGKDETDEAVHHQGRPESTARSYIPGRKRHRGRYGRTREIYIAIPEHIESKVKDILMVSLNLK